MIVLKDAKIFDGMHFLEHPADVLVEKGVVTRVSPGISAPAEARVLDLQGCVVAPGVIDTDMMASFTAEDKAALAEETPVGRLGTAEEVAKLLLYLAGEDAGYITGQVFGVNGGLVI